MKKVDDQALALLKSQLKSGALGVLYVFYGPERYLLEHYVEELRKKALPEGMEAFNLDRLEGQGLTLQKLRDSVECAPMMSEKRLVIVRDYDLYKQSSDTRKGFEEMFCDLPGTCCLVFVYDVLEYKRDKRQKLAEVIGTHGLEVEFRLQDEEQLVKWMRKRLRAHGKDIAYSDAQYMLFLCGSEMHALGQELEKLAAYSKGEVVTRAELDAVVVPVLEARVFAMCSAVASGNTAKAASMLRDLASLKEEPVAILGALSWQLRGIYAAKLVLEKRLGAKDYMELTGSRSQYQAGEMLKLARRHTLAWCRDAALLCLDSDRRLKGGSRNRDRELELLLARLAG